MRNYELVVIYHPDLEIDLDKALKKVEAVVTSASGKLLFTENWGKRKLAYNLKNQDYGVYVYYEIEIDSSKLGVLQNQLNITGEIIRYLVSKPTPSFGDREKKLMSDSPETADSADEENKSEKKDRVRSVEAKSTKEGEEEE